MELRLGVLLLIFSLGLEHCIIVNMAQSFSMPIGITQSINTQL